MPPLGREGARAREVALRLIASEPRHLHVFAQAIGDDTERIITLLADAHLRAAFESIVPGLDATLWPHAWDAAELIVTDRRETGRAERIEMRKVQLALLFSDPSLSITRLVRAVRFLDRDNVTVEQAVAYAQAPDAVISGW